MATHHMEHDDFFEVNREGMMQAYAEFFHDYAEYEYSDVELRERVTRLMRDVVRANLQGNARLREVKDEDFC